MIILAAAAAPKNEFGFIHEPQYPPADVYIIFGILIALLCTIIFLFISHKFLKKDKFKASRNRYEFRSKLLVKIGLLAFMIGLCETLINIYRASIMVAITGNSDFSSYIGPIAEASIFTILGLILAILAYCAHIYVAHKNMRLMQKIKTAEQLPI